MISVGLDRKHVKADLRLPSRQTRQIPSRQTAQTLSFPTVDRFLRKPKRFIAPAFNFNEDQGTLVFAYEINFAKRGTRVSFNDAVTLFLEVLLTRPLRLPALCTIQFL